MRSRRPSRRGDTLTVVTTAAFVVAATVLALAVVGAP